MTFKVGDSVVRVKFENSVAGSLLHVPLFSVVVVDGFPSHNPDLIDISDDPESFHDVKDYMLLDEFLKNSPGYMLINNKVLRIEEVTSSLTSAIERLAWAVSDEKLTEENAQEALFVLRSIETLAGVIYEKVIAPDLIGDVTDFIDSIKKEGDFPVASLHRLIEMGTIHQISGKYYRDGKEEELFLNRSNKIRPPVDTHTVGEDSFSIDSIEFSFKGTTEIVPQEIVLRLLKAI